MKRKLIYSTSKPSGNPTNIETIYKISHKDCKRKRNLRKTNIDLLKKDTKFKFLNFGVMNNDEPDIIEEMRINILNNHELPFSINEYETIYKLMNNKSGNTQHIGQIISDYRIKYL